MESGTDGPERDAEDDVRVATIVLLITAPAAFLMADLHWRSGFDAWKALHLALFVVLFAHLAFGVAQAHFEQCLVPGGVEFAPPPRLRIVPQPHVEEVDLRLLAGGRIVATLANAAMLAGLLGTVSGLISCFEAVANVNPYASASSRNGSKPATARAGGASSSRRRGGGAFLRVGHGEMVGA